ncbi:MAG TPA: helix-turn-helix domain-containing protein [Conexibacter sp.]|nr:helix-turn-helix domain-containing protein [Conexibacter sp.]
MRVSDLVAHSDFRLSIRAGGDNDGRPVWSTHISDLPDPARYLSEGELVLTNGLWLEWTDARSWIGQLTSQDVAAVGFGIGTPHPAVPPELIAACEASALPLLEIPETVSFAELDDFVGTHLAVEREGPLRRSARRTQRLLDALTGERRDGYRSLLNAFRAGSDLESSIVTSSGKLVASVGKQPTDAELETASAALRNGTLPLQISDRASAFSISVRARGPALLVLAPQAGMPDEVRDAIDELVAYATVETVRQQGIRDALLPVSQEFVELLAGGLLRSDQIDARLRTLGLDPSARFFMVATNQPLESLRAALEDVHLDHTVGVHNGTAVALVEAPASGDTKQAANALFGYLQAVEGEPALGAGAAASDLAGLRRSLAGAIGAVRVVSRQPGGGVGTHLEAQSHEFILGVIDGELLGVFEHAVLGAVERWDAAHGSDLVETVETFLEEGARWRSTAARLHVHTNTLRYRLRRVEELTGRDLGKTADRVDLYLALQARSRRSSSARTS